MACGACSVAITSRMIPPAGCVCRGDDDEERLTQITAVKVKRVVGESLGESRSRRETCRGREGGRCGGEWGPIAIRPRFSAEYCCKLGTGQGGVMKLRLDNLR